MAKPAISAIVRPAQYIVSRQAEAFVHVPSSALRQWVTSNCVLDKFSGSVFIQPDWTPSSFPYAKADYQTDPPDMDAFIQSMSALGRGDVAVGFGGSTTYSISTPWTVMMNTTNLIGRNRGVVISFLWYRPSDSVEATLRLYPRLDPTKVSGTGANRRYFAPFYLAIDSQNRMAVYEYPYDNYDAFTANPSTSFQKAYTHPLVVTSNTLASVWHSVCVQALSDDDILVTSDILRDGGFMYQSALDRANIWMLPEGIAGVQSTVGGLSQIEITPQEYTNGGSIDSGTLYKSEADDTYPTVKVFGWSPALIGTDRGFMTNQTIASGATGTGGVSFDVYNVITGPDGTETHELIDSDAPPIFDAFRVEVKLAATSNVSPVLNSVILDYGQATTTVADPSVDISDDLQGLSGQRGNVGDTKFTMKVRNVDDVYHAIAERPMNEVDVDLEGQDFAVLYTLNPSYEWWKTPYQGALELNWETGDGFEYLKRELCAKMPPYDGQLLSNALTEFMNRLGYDASRLDIDATPGLYLPKKRGREEHQFKPEDGCPAADFINKLKEWFGTSYTCRFGRDGKFQFKAIPVDPVSGMETPTIARTYYPMSDYKTAPDDHVLYADFRVEIMMENFYNEIWVCGEDKRTGKALVSMYRNVPSQTDKNSPNYVGRRLLMIVLTKVNRQGDLDNMLDRLVAFYGRWRVRANFNTRLDPLLQKDDFIRLYGVALTWRVTGINYDVNLANVAQSTINSATPVIKGMAVCAEQWPVRT